MTANSSLSGPQGPGTFVEQSAVMARGGHRNPCGPLSTPTAPCTGPLTSLFRQFAPKLSLPSCGFPIVSINRKTRSAGGNEIWSETAIGALREAKWPHGAWKRGQRGPRNGETTLREFRVAAEMPLVDCVAVWDGWRVTVGAVRFGEKQKNLHRIYRGGFRFLCRRDYFFF